MSLQLTHKLIDSIIDKRKDYLSSLIQKYPRTQFIASDVVDCNRYLYYSISNWKDRPSQDEELQALFRRGNDEERLVIRDLLELGFDVVQQQVPFEIKNNLGDIICRGKIDGKILFERKAIPFEIKLMNSNVFNSIKTVDDFDKNKFYKKYIKQMQLYLYGNNEDSGFFIISDGRGHLKLLIVELDYGLCETILQRLEQSWKAVKSKRCPSRVDYSFGLCDKCSFLHICLPDIKNDAANFIDNEELEATLDRYTELKTTAKEFEEIDKQIKSTFKGIADSFVGSKYRIISTKQECKRLDASSIPDDIKQKYTIQSEKWITKVLELDK